MMPASQIVRLLITYRSLLVPELELLDTKIDLISTSVSSEYSFITFDVRDSKEEDLICRIKFELDAKAGKLIEVYCSNKSVTEKLSASLKKKKFPGFDAKDLENDKWTDEVRNSIEQADKIAGVAANCTNGDNYRPGNFSLVAIHQDHIVLSQVNRMNSKSLDHKNDYSIRDLIMTIPLSDNYKVCTSSRKIGEMNVLFHDASSANNRRCGDNIEKMLNELAEK